MNNQVLKKKTVSGVVSYSIRTLFTYGIAVAATGLLSVYLNPREFGVYFIVTAAIGIFTFLSDVGLAAALIQKKEEPTRSELRSTFTVQQILAVIIMGLIVALTPYWKSKAHLDADGLGLLYALAFSFYLASLKTIPSILLERKLAFDRLVVPQMIEQVIFYGLAVWLAMRGMGVKSYTAAVLARSIIGVVAIYVIQRWHIGFELDWKVLKKLLSFGVKFQANDLLARLKDDLYVVVLAMFLPARDMGYVGWAKRWSMFPYQFSVNSVVAITFPTFSRLQQNKLLLKSAIEKALFFISLIIFPILAGVVAMARPLIGVIAEYQKWTPALPSLYLFCVNIAFAAISSPLTNTLNAVGEINKTLKLMVMWTVLTWTLTPLTIRWWGMTGIAATSALIGLTSLLTIKFAKQIVEFNFIDAVWRQLAASSIMLVVLMMIEPFVTQSFLHLMMGVGLGIVIYVLLIMLLGYKTLMRNIKSLRTT